MSAGARCSVDRLHRKLVENRLHQRDICGVITTKVDNRKRVLVPQAKPGEVYGVHEHADGSFTLTVVKPVEMGKLKCRVAKESGFTVVVPGQAINEGAIKELLTDFP
jgi:hypothetical protein